MYRVEIRSPEPGRSTIPLYSDSFFRIAETAEEVEDLKAIYGNRIIAVVRVAESETASTPPPGE